MTVSSLGSAPNGHRAAMRPTRICGWHCSMMPSRSMALRVRVTRTAVDSAGVAQPPQATARNASSLLFVATTAADRAASYPRIDCEVEAGARLSLIERHLSLVNEANFINSAVRINIGPDARVQHYRVQQPGAARSGSARCRPRWRSARNTDCARVNLGGLTARSTVRVRLAGARAEAGLYDVSVGDWESGAGRLRARWTTSRPGTRTEQTFRGIAAGRARVACNGKMVVRSTAPGRRFAPVAARSARRSGCRDRRAPATRDLHR